MVRLGGMDCRLGRGLAPPHQPDGERDERHQGERAKYDRGNHATANVAAATSGGVEVMAVVKDEVAAADVVAAAAAAVAAAAEAVTAAAAPGQRRGGCDSRQDDVGANRRHCGAYAWMPAARAAGGLHARLFLLTRLNPEMTGSDHGCTVSSDGRTNSRGIRTPWPMICHRGRFGSIGPVSIWSAGRAEGFASTPGAGFAALGPGAAWRLSFPPSAAEAARL